MIRIRGGGRRKAYTTRFAAALDQHLFGGTRPAGEFRRWANAEFGTAIGGITEKAVRNWRESRNLPVEVAPILRVLFGDNEDLASQREELLRAYHDAKLVFDRALEERAASTSDWEAYGAEALCRGLAELFIHPPPLSNVPDTFPLRISLYFAQYPDEVDGVGLRFGLTAASLVPSYENCQPVRGTRLGEEASPHPNLSFRAGVWYIERPVQQDGHLEGKPIDDEPLCVIECNSEGKAEVLLLLRSRLRALDVVAEDRTDISTSKQKILKVFLQSCQPKDSDGYITWGRAAIRRQKE